MQLTVERTVASRVAPSPRVCRVAAMFAANPQFDIWPYGATAFSRDRHQFADPIDVNGHERIPFHQTKFLIAPQEARRIVARQAESGLRQIVGSE